MLTAAVTRRLAGRALALKLKLVRAVRRIDLRQTHRARSAMTMLSAKPVRDQCL